ncbi:MAG: LacI family DNA-binding transcriptional regulator [Sphingomonadales bacterium]|nr:LacI family DNA-binding transcriptional regulator [Sphingomonadales bacterium]
MANGGGKGGRTRNPRGGGRGPTIADVAREAGVSPMTVSRVINRGGNVVAATQEKVEQAIARLGYVPNPAARSLAGGRHCRIALLHGNPSAAYLSEFLMGSLAEAGRRDAQLVVEYCEEPLDPAPLVGRLAAHRIDAVLLPPPLCDDGRLVAALVQAGLPFAQIATGQPHPSACAVTIDDEAAAHAITARLLALGHRRIGLIRGNPNQTASALREAGYRRALTEGGVTVPADYSVPGDFSYRSGLAAAERLLDMAAHPTAIFACNDDMAAAAVAVAHRRGLDVPGDLSVCGFDDTAMATTIWPELTTIRQPVARMASVGVGLLVQALRGEVEGGLSQRHERLDFELVVRDSDGKPGDPADGSPHPF